MRACMLLMTALVSLTAGISHAGSAPGAKEDALSAGFRDPPNSARPRVWWHWMNGNITKDGITKDLQWMQRVGIGGLQNFDAALDTPQIVDKRLVYMSPEWQDAFRHAVRLAAQLGLEFAIASSPGWSETGGPWVEPKDAMKKLVWSETTLVGGKPFRGKLPHPPAVAGVYQDYKGESGPVLSSGEQNAIPDFYKDAVVLAYRAEAPAALPAPTKVTSNDTPVAADTLFDDDLTTGIPLPESGTIRFEYAKPQTVRSATIFVSGISPFSLVAPIAPLLEASTDGRDWHKIAAVHLTSVPSTVSFDAVEARFFRLVLEHGKPSSFVSGFAAAPGVDMSAMTLIGAAPPASKLMEFKLGSGARVNAFEQKGGFAIADDYYELDGATGADVAGVPRESVVDITSHMGSDGMLDWTPPQGRWTVLRLGYSLTGKTNHPATAEATGLEVDKFDRAAVARYLNKYLEMYRDATGGLLGEHGIRALVTDSTQVGAANWTPHILEQFQRLRGYDARLWLPALTGVIVGSRKQSDAFLYDFRRTLADLIATEHYGTVARVAHEQGLTVYGESLEGTRATLGDDIEMRRFADIPMAALWTYKKAPQPHYVGDVRGAASTAHIYGRTLVAAESLTSILAPWAYAPADLQPMIDAEFVHGVNRPVIHTSVHQPVDDKVPGLSLMIFGQYFNRHETWAEMAKPWVDYLARNGYMLQQGRNAADVAYFYGEDQPLGAQAAEDYFADVPTRYAYDFLSPDALLHESSYDGNAIATKGGARYRAIYLGGQSRRMTLQTLQRLAELAEAGATIVGDAPQSSPSLKDDPKAFAALVQQLWSGAKVTNVGKGRVIAGKDIEGALTAIGVTPDFDCSPQSGEVMFVHRQIQDGDIYFVDNRSTLAQSIDAKFRVTGKAPEIWHADTGTTAPVSYRIESDRTVVALDMQPQESFFVVFRKDAAASFATIPERQFAPIAEMSGSWDVAFQPGRGAPAAARLESLTSLSEHADPGIKYFSGTATYTKDFTLPKGTKPGTPLLVDLGRLGDVAEVRVNGKLAGTAWKAPYRVDIGALVRSGRNTLAIRVANLWVNRLIGDAQPGARKITFTTLPTYVAKAALRPSGLIGPVVLMKSREIPK